MSPEISIIVISYKMARELPRTLLSLTSRYQQHCPPGRCEVLLIDNGTPTPPRRDNFANLDLDLSVHVWPNPTPSPAAAINHGLSLARAPLIGVWIDGARLASPGLIDACARAAALHPRAVVATFNYHLGPDIQVASVLKGYDRQEEDRLLDSIDWPNGAHRLSEISTPVWHSGAHGPMLESNALFMSRTLWDELGGYDERFVGPGGGGVNPDVFIRACEQPETQLIRVKHEGTYHQYHGGTISNAPNYALDAGKQLASEYYRIRRKPLRAVRETGWLFDPRTGTVTTDRDPDSAGHGGAP